MSMIDFRSPGVWTVSTCAILAVGAGVWGLSLRHPADDSGLPKEYSVDALKAQAEDPIKMMETMRGAMRREDLTDEQRRQLGENMRDVWQKIMQQRVDEYYNATEDQKDAVLDKHIEEFQARMKEMEQRRKEWEKEQEQADKDKKPDDKNSPWRRAFGAPTQQERKAQSESRNPDQMARAMAYFGAMQKRAAERGIKLPQMGPGGGRGFGRGPGGPGGSAGPRPGTGP